MAVPGIGGSLVAVALLIAASSLLFALGPFTVEDLHWGLDMRNWSRGVAFSATLFVLLLLLGIRFGSDIWERIARRDRNYTSQTIPTESSVPKDADFRVDRSAGADKLL